MHNKIILWVVLAFLSHPLLAHAKKVNSGVPGSPTTTETDFATLKQRFGLSDDDIQKLKDSSLRPDQYPLAAALAQNSKKSMEEILKMHSLQKMGWGKIAKKLGLKPNIIGKSAADYNHKERTKRRKGSKQK